MVSLSNRQNHFVRRLARIGLTAKGVVYLALGALAFMAAFELSGHQENEATKAGVLQWLQNTAGSFVLMLIAIGLACYCAWRFAQAFTSNGVHKKWPERGRYLLSGLAYTSVAITAATLALHRDNNNGGDQNQYWIASLLEKPMGMVLVGIGAIILAVIGI